MIHYIVQVVLFQVVFLAVYDLFLQKETFFKWNRLYLLATPIISFIVPLLKFESFKNAVPEEYILMLPEVMLNREAAAMHVVETFNYVSLFFYIVAGLIFLLFLFKLNSIIRLIMSSKRIEKKDYYLVLLENKQAAFSFFNFIFLDKTVSKKEELHIIQHELVHCKQYHTLDLLFFELLKIVMWFNPLVYLYQNRITLLHEYISDEKVVQGTDKKAYFNKLLSQTFNVEDISFVNQFYKPSLLKKRIAMITKNKSKKLKKLKYLVLIPLLGSMLLYSSCETNKQVNENDARLEKQTWYTFKEGKLTSEKDGSESYLDRYRSFDQTEIKLEAELISEDVLLPKEKAEYDKILYMSRSKISLFQIKGGRKIAFINLKPEIKEISDREQFNGKEDIPFRLIEEPPVYPGCAGSKEELKACLNKSLQIHIVRKFNADLAGTLGLEPGKKKIYIQFKILNDGTVKIVGARAPHPDLETEARRVVNLIPKMNPGKQGGKSVNVTYMLPLSFNVEGEVTN